MEQKYQVGDLILLRKEPHKGTAYPTVLKEIVEKNEPVEISKLGGTFSKTDGLYVVNIDKVPYTIYSDEIAGLYSHTTLFL